MKDNKEMAYKALSQSETDSWGVEDITSMITKTKVTPHLLTALLGGEEDSYFGMTDVVKFDELFEEIQAVSGKRYDEFGPDLKKDDWRRHSYRVGSFGVRGNAAPADYANRRNPKTGELMTEEDVIANLAVKVDKSWMMFEEESWASILTADTNATFGGPQPAYNYYTDIEGSARAAAVNVDILGVGDIADKMTAQVDILMDNLTRTGNSFSGNVVCLCGADFFAKRLEAERDVDLVRDLRNTLDMASMGVPTDSFGEVNFMYQNFYSQRDGVWYVRYNASIRGTALIGASDAYLLPLGVDNMFAKAYAPARTRQYVNTTALPRYDYIEFHDRKGATLSSEKNVLMLNKAPSLIIPLTST